MTRKLRPNPLRPAMPPPKSSLTVMEWGPGNGNLAACSQPPTASRQGGASLSHGQICSSILTPLRSERARTHPDLIPHLSKVESLCAEVENMATIADGTVDRIICNHMKGIDWPASSLSKKGGEYEEHLVNLNQRKAAAIADWSGFVRAFDAKDIEKLKQFPPFLRRSDLEVIRKVIGRTCPIAKLSQSLWKAIDDEVLVPVNLGACASIKEAKRVLAPNVINSALRCRNSGHAGVGYDPEKPCYGQFGGRSGFMVNGPDSSCAKLLGSRPPLNPARVRGQSTGDQRHDIDGSAGLPSHGG